MRWRVGLVVLLTGLSAHAADQNGIDSRFNGCRLGLQRQQFGRQGVQSLQLLRGRRLRAKQERTQAHQTQKPLHVQLVPPTRENSQTLNSMPCANGRSFDQLMVTVWRRI